jgi:betaine lipid synthase
MYASTWICTKEQSIVQEDVKLNLRKSSMGELKI